MKHANAFCGKMKSFYGTAFGTYDNSCALVAKCVGKIPNILVALNIRLSLSEMLSFVVLYPEHQAIYFFEAVLRAPSGGNFQETDCELDTYGVKKYGYIVDCILVPIMS
jgi:hypothetical protein